MRIVDIREAKMHLSRLVDAAAGGEPFVIARAGRPLVEVTAVAAPASGGRRLGFLAGQISVPPGFDRFGSAEIARRFEGSG